MKDTIIQIRQKILSYKKYNNIVSKTKATVIQPFYKNLS